MATAIYRCKKCNATKRVAYRAERHPIGYGRFEAQYRRESDGAIGPRSETCCGRSMTFGWLKAFLNPAVKCNARCTHAVGFSCECSCAGENHATRGGMFTQLMAA